MHAGYERYVRACFSHPFALMLGFLVPTVWAVLAGSQIELRTDLKDLLPLDAPSVVAMEEARARRGSSDLFAIAVTSPDPVANVEAVRALERVLSEWDEVEYFDNVQEQAFFRKHALLLLPVEDLERIRSTLQRMVRQRLGQANPLFVDLEEEDDDPDFDWRSPDAWVHPMTRIELGLEEDQFEQFFPVRAASTTEESAPRTGRAALPEEMRDYRVNEEGSVALFQAKLRGVPTDISYARSAYERGIEAIEAAELTALHPEMRAEVVGAYRSFLEVQAVARDVQVATSLAILLVLVLLVFFFRNIRAVLILLLPLLAGVAWTLGLLDLVFGHLNTLTAFVFAMLIGMGIDFAIHLYRRIQEEMAAGLSAEEACVRAGLKTGRALATAALTTCAALLTLTLANFTGFREFGVACALGVAACWLATITLVPLLVALTDRLRASTPRKHAAVQGAVAWEHKDWIRGLGVAVGALALVGAVLAPQAKFEYDFSRLSGPGTGRTISYGSAVGSTRGTAPAVLVAQSEESMRAAHLVLRERLRDGDPWIKGFMTIETFLPTDQEARMEVIDDIADILDRRAVRQIDGDERDVLDALEEMADIEPYVLEDLPSWVVRLLQERDGSVGALGLFYAEFDRDDVADVARFQAAWGVVPTAQGEVLLSSGSFILSDVIDYVQADGRRLPFYVVAALALLLLLDLRSVRGVLVCLVTLGSAAAMTAGAMALLDVRVGLFNMIVLPMVLGLGVDGAIHMVHRSRELGVERMAEVLRSTGYAVWASSLTTVAGFVGLVLVTHKGVNSIGALALIGIAAVLVAVLGLLPALLVTLSRLGKGART